MSVTTPLSHRTAETRAIMFAHTDTSQKKGVAFLGRFTQRQEGRDAPVSDAARDAQYDAIVDWGIPDHGVLQRPNASDVRAAFHHPVARLGESHLPIEPMHVACVQQPPAVFVGPVVDHVPQQPLAQSAPAVLGEHIHVGEIGERNTIGHGAAETDLPFSVVEADDAARLVDEPLLCFQRSADRPVRLRRQERVDGLDVDPALVVVEFDAHALILAMGSLAQWI